MLFPDTKFWGGLLHSNKSGNHCKRKKQTKQLAQGVYANSLENVHERLIFPFLLFVISQKSQGDDSKPHGGVYSFDEYLQSACCIPGSVPGAEML